MSARDPQRTRRELLDAAAAEIHRKGFQAASLAAILSHTGVTKGALYHHFPNKKALGLAVLDRVEQTVLDLWVRPLEGADDPVRAFQEALRRAAASLEPADIELGCPLNNLAQELSAVDEEFRARVVAVYDKWREGIARALARGQGRGTVDPTVDPRTVAAFVVASLTGGRGLAKTARSPELLDVCVRGLSAYLDTLRARR